MAKLTNNEKMICLQLGEDPEIFAKKKDLAKKLAKQFGIREVQALQCVNHVFLNPYQHNGSTWTQKATQEIERRFARGMYIAKKES